MGVVESSRRRELAARSDGNTHELLPPFAVEKKEWTAENQVATNTDPITVPLIAKLNEETKELIEKRRLGDGVNWLWKVAPGFFYGADFDLEVLSGEDEEDTVLALKVYGSLSASEFSNQNHALCDAMRETGYNTLYEVISIFQRRIHRYERQAISFDGTLFADAA